MLIPVFFTVMLILIYLENTHMTPGRYFGFAIVFVLFIALPSYLELKNRIEAKLEIRAAEYIKKRYSARKRIPVGELVASTGLGDGMRSRAVWLVETMAKLAGIDPELLRADDIVGDLWTLHRREVTGPDREKWSKSKLGEDLIIDAAYHDVFLEIMDILVPPDRDWDYIWNMLPEGRRPVKEDYDGEMWDNAIWYDTLMHMTFREMLLFMYDGVWPERLG